MDKVIENYINIRINRNKGTEIYRYIERKIIKYSRIHIILEKLIQIQIYSYIYIELYVDR